MIWGIGLPKTGTTSCVRAFAILGYQAHHHDPNVIGLLSRGFRGIDFHYLLNCAEFPLIDELMPGGRFIYTERDVESWLESVDLHMNVRYRSCSSINPGFAYWRMKLFASVNPTKQQFLEARRRQEELVTWYFRDTPERLLRIRICDGEGWEVLCPFLGRPLPFGTPFPLSNAARSRPKSEA
jgi:hypothetical protein